MQLKRKEKEIASLCEIDKTLFLKTEIKMNNLLSHMLTMSRMETLHAIQS